MARIGWIGIGNMGSRMSRRLLEAGHELAVCDKIKENARELIGDGAVFVENPSGLCDKADYIFSMIPNAPILKEIMAGENGVLKSVRPGTILIDMSTIDPGSSAEVNKLIEPTGAKFLRATVTGSVAYAAEGTLGIMASGDRDVFDQTLPLLKILGNRQRYLGDQEQSRFMKICINMMLGTTMQMLAESLVMGEKAGIDWETMVECICDSAAAANIVKAKEQALKQRDFTAMATSVMMEKDMNIAMELAREYELALPVAAVSRQYYAAMRAHDMGQIDYSGLILLNEKICGIKS